MKGMSGHPPLYLMVWYSVAAQEEVPLPVLLEEQAL